MSKDNLILFPKKSKSTISMSESEAKWMVAGSLLVVLVTAIGINSTLFANKSTQGAGLASQVQATSSRSLASINPIVSVSWEKKAFEVLKKSGRRDLANVGQKPSVFDDFAIGTLEGNYLVREIDGQIKEIRFAENPETAPMALKQRQNFLQKNLALFSDQATAVEQVQIVENDELWIEKFRLVGQHGKDLGTVQMLLDKDQNLLSMTVQ